MIKWPHGIATKVAKAFAAAITLIIDNTLTYVTIDQLTAAITINVTPLAEQAVGDKLHIVTSADGTNRLITWGTGFTGVAYTNTASKSFIHDFIYDGATFVHQGSTQLN